MAHYNYIRTEKGERIVKQKSDASKKPNNYTDVAWLYDLDEHGLMERDLPFYLEYAKKTNATEILDLCCGTGRVSIFLAEQGYNVTGLDLSLPMLEVFEEKYEALDPVLKKRINIINGNAISFELDKKFDLIIIPYRSFQQFAHRSEAADCLSCIKRHLTDNGIFILSVYRPQGDMATWGHPKKMQWSVFDAERGYNITKYHWGTKSNTEHQLIYPVLCYELLSAGGELKVVYEDLTLKYYYYRQLVEMLENAGFNINEEYGDYKKINKDEGTEYIFVCSSGGK